MPHMLMLSIPKITEGRECVIKSFGMSNIIFPAFAYRKEWSIKKIRVDVITSFNSVAQKDIITPLCR